MRNIPWPIISKYFQKQASLEELALLRKWLCEDSENEMLFNEAFNIHTLTAPSPEPMAPDQEKAWNRINQRISKKSRHRKIWFAKIKYASAVAAIFLIGFSAFWLINTARDNQIFQQETNIISPLGQKTMVVLPDSSLVWLNSGSTLTYKGNFNLKEREVVLEGEAFFEVQKNRSKLFRVKSGILNVNVYGTSFDIKNHKNDDFQEITVSEGCVGISDKSGEIRSLTRGEQATLDKKTNKITFSKSIPEIVSAWKNNELIFDNTPLEEVVKYLERWYGVKITLDNALVGNHKYTLKLKTESFREVLDMLKIVTPIEYEIKGKDVVIHYIK